ncbi:hypothetical protein M9H77_00227 [Catharanthus roseus]|nr:hypothetical protein M9H77_00227 [Catharanthus roseus]
MTKNVCLFFIRPCGQDVQVKLVFVTECLALFRQKRETTSVFEVSISSVLLVNINPQVFVTECLAPFRRKRCALTTVYAVIFMMKNICLFFIRPYGQDTQVKLFLLVHINPQVSVSEFLAPIRRKR